MSNWFRSLSWRLQFWHAMILLAVVVGFGAILHWEVARARWDEVDAELMSRARILEGALRSAPRPVLDSLAQDLSGPGRPLPRPQRLPHEEGMPPRRPEMDRQPPRPMDGQRGRPPNPPDLEWQSNSESSGQAMEDWEKWLVFPTKLPVRTMNGDEPTYYIIWREDGSVLRESNVPFASRERPDARGLNGPTSMLRSIRGQYREVSVRGPHSTMISVGKDVLPEIHRLDGFALELFGIGTVIMIGGLAGGWWLGRRAVVPILRMTETASAITETSLDQRIPVKNFDVELEQLGNVLNAMLGRLENAFDQQKQFTADASHELRTPLSIILSSTELALARPRTPEEYREHILKCQRAAERTKRLVESLLALARLDARGFELTKESNLALHTIVDDNVRLLLDIAAKHQVRLDVFAEPCLVNGNATALGQMVTNLVHNAIIYNQPQGTVTVALRCEGSMAVLTVADTGIGIAAEDTEHLFDRFYRADKARSRAVGGSGLGLAICKKIVSLHGGTIGVKSEPGVGSQFRVELPIATKTADAVLTDASNEPSSNRGGDPPLENDLKQTVGSV